MAAITIQFQNILSLILAILFVIVMAIVSGRLLGVRVGRGRSFLAALVGCIAGIAGAVAAAPHRSDFERGLLAILFGVLGTMVLIVIMEALRAPEGKGAQAVSAVTAAPLQVDSPETVPGRTCLGGAPLRPPSGPGAFPVRVGRRSVDGGVRSPPAAHAGGLRRDVHQVRADRLDAHRPARRAGDRGVVPTSGFGAPDTPEELRALVEDELARPVDEVFASFEWEPLAAASIGQTHRAVLTTGEHVVVKIQRPGLEELLERDATVLRLMAGLAERRIPAARLLGMRDLAEDLIAGMERELDYHRESAMSHRLADESGEDTIVNIPATYDEVSTGRLLVMEEVVGHSVDDALALSTCGVPRERLARSLLRAFLRQVIQGGAYHADPHPGNIFVDDLGRLWLLDFGAVGLLDPLSRESLQEMALGMSLGEPQLVARAVRRMAGTDSISDLRVLEADIGLLMVEASGQEFDPKLIGEVLATMSRHGLRPPRSMFQLSRALLTLDGTLRGISPDFDLPGEATALIKEVAQPEGEASGQVLERELLRALPALRELPQHFDEIATQLRAGRLSVRTERMGGRDEQVLRSWLDLVLMAAVGIGGGMIAGLLLVAASLSRSVTVAEALRVIGFIGIVLSGVLLIRTVAQVFQRRP